MIGIGLSDEGEKYYITGVVRVENINGFSRKTINVLCRVIDVKNIVWEEQNHVIG